MRFLTVLVVALSGLPLVTLAGTAHADLLYQFDVHETTSLGFQPFSFSFTVPTFVTAGQSPAFTPFTVTASGPMLPPGTQSYTMIHDLANVSGGNGCFLFSTGGGASIGPGCSFSAVKFTEDGAITLDTPGGLPTATGVQTLLASSGGQFGNSTAGVIATFGGTLDITSVTSVPEPATVALLSLGVAAVGWTLRRRRGVAF